VATGREPLKSEALAALQAEFPGRCIPVPCDVTDAASIRAMADVVRSACGGAGIDLLLNVAGVLHDETGLSPERSLREVDAARMARVFQVNAVGPVLVTQALQPELSQGAVIGNLSARVGSISDNNLGGWWSYRMSKAALNQATRNIANEMRRRKVIAVSLHPGTTDTGLSKPFQKNVRPEKLFTPDYTAGALLDVLENLKSEDSGGFFAYDGSPIVF
jgi:NAD(P)-dependent dehydrogenase (short-subunit alcohol dehydrogenase family)